MYSVNLKLPAKGVIAVITALLCCIMMLGTVVFAASAEQTVKLNANGSEAQLVMDFPQAAAEEIASMQISLIISPSSESADIEFIPDSGLSAKIVESRYHSDTGVLTVYLAGTKALFSDSTPLKVGKIKIGGTNVSAAVKVDEGSIKFVRGSLLVIPDGDVLYPGSVTISTGSNAPVPPPFIPPSSSSSTQSPSTPSSSSSSSDTSVPEESNGYTEPGLEPLEPADTSSLEQAVDRAEGYKRGDYTEESFGTLTDALNKAKAVLSNSGSTQDEVDEALLVLENAIGMLTSSHTAPSGTDDYTNSSSDDISLPGSNNNGSSGSSAVSSATPSDSSGGDIGSNGQTVGGEGNEQNPGSQTSGTSNPGDSEKEKSGSNAVMWILIVMAVLAVAAAALFAAIKFKKK